MLSHLYGLIYSMFSGNRGNIIMLPFLYGTHILLLLGHFQLINKLHIYVIGTHGHIKTT